MMDLVERLLDRCNRTMVARKNTSQVSMYIALQYVESSRHSQEEWKIIVDIGIKDIVVAAAEIPCSNSLSTELQGKYETMLGIFNELVAKYGMVVEKYDIKV